MHPSARRRHFFDGRSRGEVIIAGLDVKVFMDINYLSSVLICLPLFPLQNKFNSYSKSVHKPEPEAMTYFSQNSTGSKALVASSNFRFFCAVLFVNSHVVKNLSYFSIQ